MRKAVNARASTFSTLAFFRVCVCVCVCVCVTVCIRVLFVCLFVCVLNVYVCMYECTGMILFVYMSVDMCGCIVIIIERFRDRQTTITNTCG